VIDSSEAANEGRQSRANRCAGSREFTAATAPFLLPEEIRQPHQETL